MPYHTFNLSSTPATSVFDLPKDSCNRFAAKLYTSPGAFKGFLIDLQRKMAVNILWI